MRKHMCPRALACFRVQSRALICIDAPWRAVALVDVRRNVGASIPTHGLRCDVYESVARGLGTFCFFCRSCGDVVGAGGEAQNRGAANASSDPCGRRWLREE
eukprot:2665593-Alexandrium_andersonii.AAC.1